MSTSTPSSQGQTPSRRDFLKVSAITTGTTLMAGVFANPDVLGQDAKPFDYIVIGAGSSGCVVANRLTEDKDVRVLLLEAGGPDDRKEIHDPGRQAVLMGSELDWNYLTEPEPHLDNRKLVWPRGKVLGGSSSINRMVYVRGHRLDYDHWNYLGNEGWSYQDVLPYFKRSEDNDRGASDYHGVGGLLSVTGGPTPGPAGEAFLDAAKTLGFEVRPDGDFNGAKQEGFAAFYQSTVTKTGKRHSTAAAFLAPILNQRPNLEVRTRAQVKRLLWDKRRVVGVEYLHDGKSHEVRAAREVIVSAGVVESPKLLMLSGIGPAAHLQAHRVAVVVDLPGVGQNLQDHPALWPMADVAMPFPFPKGREVAGLFLSTRSGLAASSPDLQFHFAGFPGEGEKGLEKVHVLSFSPTLVRPRSVGSLGLRSADPLDPPVIRANYLETETDLDVLVKAVELFREIIAAKGFQALRGKRVDPGPEVKTREEMRAYVRRTVQTQHHQVGTCKMGRDRMAVVDPQLRVHGVEGLRVADASIMPVLVNGNTNAPCIMIGEKAADLIKSSRK